jgi:hypothetical protein
VRLALPAAFLNHDQFTFARDLRAAFKEQGIALTGSGVLARCNSA